MSLPVSAFGLSALRDAARCGAAHARPPRVAAPPAGRRPLSLLAALCACLVAWPAPGRGRAGGPS